MAAAPAGRRRQLPSPSGRAARFVGPGLLLQHVAPRRASVIDNGVHNQPKCTGGLCFAGCPSTVMPPPPGCNPSPAQCYPVLATDVVFSTATLNALEAGYNVNPSTRPCADASRPNSMSRPSCHPRSHQITRSWTPAPRPASTRPKPWQTATRAAARRWLRIARMTIARQGIPAQSKRTKVFVPSTRTRCDC